MDKTNENVMQRKNVLSESDKWETDSNQQKDISTASQQEDAALKVVTQFFADELLPITKDATGVDPEEIRKIEAVIYTMAGKFLDSVSMKEIEEAVRMTELGQMLVEDGRAEGRAEGRAQERTRINQLNQKLAEQNRTDDILKSARNTEYQNKLFEEFNL